MLALLVFICTQLILLSNKIVLNIQTVYARSQNYSIQFFFRIYNTIYFLNWNLLDVKCNSEINIFIFRRCVKKYCIGTEEATRQHNRCVVTVPDTQQEPRDRTFLLSLHIYTFYVIFRAAHFGFCGSLLSGQYLTLKIIYF